MTSYTVTPAELAQLQAKTVLIFGGATGFGSTAVEIAHANGANVVLADWNDQGAALAKRLGDRVVFKKCDVSNWDDVLGAFETASSKFGCIHTVLSNAGVTAGEDLLEEKYDETGRLLAPSLTSIQINLIGQLYVSRCAVLFAKKWPETKTDLVMTASAASFFASPPIFMYCAAKTGILGLMRALHLELEGSNTSVNIVCPFFTVTNLVAPEWLAIWGDLPTTPASVTATALLLSSVKEKVSGKAFFVFGHEIVDFEETLDKTAPEWMGEDLCAVVRKGIERLRSKTNITT
ncbi:NAD(P)-binding protein [Aspergillus unguis]